MTLPSEVMKLLPGTPTLKERLDAKGRPDPGTAARRLGLNTERMLSLIRAGDLHPIRDKDGQWWFDPAELEEVARHPERTAARPSIGDLIETRLPRPFIERLERLAAEQQVGRGELMRRILIEALGGDPYDDNAEPPA